MQPRYDLNPQIIERLINEFQFKRRGDHLREGVCPGCNKKTLWTWIERPGMIQCNRTNKCLWHATSKELFPDLFEDLNKKYPATKENPNETADAYLAMIRGFDLKKIKGWYEQGSYYHPRAKSGTATVRFYLDDAKNIMWERLIDDVTLIDEDGTTDTRNKNFKGKFKGHWWQPPGLTLNENDEIYWCEGILDAIALNLNGYKAVAIMSSGTFPDVAIQPHLNKNIKWVLALDNDATGRRCLQKHAAKLRELNQTIGAALSSDDTQKSDWNDLHKAGQLSVDDMKRYRHLGRVALAQNPYQKALALWNGNRKKSFFVYPFKYSTYSFKIDRSEFEKALDQLNELYPERPDKNEKDAFEQAATIKEIATFKMDFLYFQQPDNGEDGQYFFRFNFSNRAPEVQLAFAGKTFGSAGDFKKAVMHKTPSALFTGSTKELDFMYQSWMGHIPKIVKTLDYIGYDKDTNAYVYTDYAVENGRVLTVNDESFFQLKQTGIKSTVEIKQKLNPHVSTDWLNDFQTAYGQKGLIALAWWFGCLFVEQVRHKHRSYPFFEVIGEASSGKSALVDFLWKLLGREGESFNPNSSTLAGRTRKMAEVSNLPVVFNETDNEKSAEDRHQKRFAWDEQKDLYDGEFGRVTGIKSNDNTTKKPRFKAGLMIVQNIPVNASEAIMSRIVHLTLDRSHHTPEGKHAADRLNILPTETVSGFLLHSIKSADAILNRFEQQFQHHRHTLQRHPEIKMARIIENHAKIMAFADCLAQVLPLSPTTLNDLHHALTDMAVERQQALNEEHPIVQQFWSQFDYLDSRSIGGSSQEIKQNLLNHSSHPTDEIAINLEHFRSQCAEYKLDVMDTKELRRYLPTSRKREYIRNEPIRSNIENRTVRCWIFKR